MPSTVSAPHSATIHLSAPTDLDHAQKILAQVLGKLGCGRCFSGFDIRFNEIREFVVNPKTFEVNEFGH